MKIFKSHFWYNKSQRNGIFLLAISILIFQAIIVFVDFSSDEIVDENTPEVLIFQKQIDSLRAIEIEHRKPKIYPFNPNYITDYKGEKLGMSLAEIDRLLIFRKTNKFINSKKEFQQVTKISDSLLNKIAPYFKFPDWVIKRNQKLEKQNSSLPLTKVVSNEAKQSHNTKQENKVSTTDINKATITDIQTIKGIDGKLAARIIKYRSKLQGFSFESQLSEVWGLTKVNANNVLAMFKILKKPSIIKANVNTIEFKELLKNPYLDYELCIKIFNFRDEVAELQNISELKNIPGFPLDTYERIVLYLIAE
jgi:hypothetical protein